MVVLRLALLLGVKRRTLIRAVMDQKEIQAV